MAPSTPDVPPILNPYDINDPAAVAQAKKRLEDRWKTANHRRYFFELNWLRNVLYRVGVQWIRIDWSGREVRNLSLAPNFPRAITNKYGKVQSDLQNSIMGGKVPLNARPNRENPEDVSTAEIYESLRDVMDSETNVPELKRDLSFWLTETGNGFILPYYDYNVEYGTQPVPQFQCSNPGCNAGPGGMPQTTLDANQPCPCGGPPPLPPAPPEMDQMGNPVPATAPPVTPPYQQSGTQDMPIGRLIFRTLSPFEVYQDNTIRIGTGKRRWFFTPDPTEVETARKTWPDFADKIKPGMPEPMKPSRSYLTAIAYAGSFLSGTTGSGEAAAREEMKNKVIPWKFYELPSVEYPQGLYAAQVGENVVELKPLPNEWGTGRLQGVKILPLVHFYQETSGGAWGRPRANDIWPIQARRNIIESNLQLTAQRTGAPKLLEPLGSGLTIVTGEAGQRMQYKPITFGGTTAAEPHYLEAALGNVQPLILLIDKLDSAMEELAGTHFVSGADAPSGVTAASALAFLGEKANQAISPLKEQWAESWATVYQIAMEIIRVHWTDDRFNAILGRNKEWQFQKFKQSDLTGSISIRVDNEALFPKSDATIRADIMQLSQMGILLPGDPEQDFAVLLKFGHSDLKMSMDEALQQASREWDAFLNENQPPVLIPMVQNAKLHLMQHLKDAQTQEFEILYRTNQQKADIWVAHIQATQMEVIQMSIPMAPEPAPPGGPAGPKQPGSQHGSQNGPAKGNLQNSAPIKKGTSNADSGAPPAEAVPPPA